MNKIVLAVVALMITSCSPIHLKYDNNMGKLFKHTGFEADTPERKTVGHTKEKDVLAAEKLFTLLREKAGLPVDAAEVRNAALALVKEFFNSRVEDGEQNATYELLEAELNKTGKSLKDVDIAKTIVVGLLIGIGR
jgi:hypothetical protein